MGFVCIPCSVLCFGARSHLFILQRLFALKHSYVSSWRAWWIATRENQKFCWSLRHLFVFVCEMYLNLDMSPYLRTTHVLPVTVRLSRYGWVCVAERASRSFDCLACLLLQPSCLQYQTRIVLFWARYCIFYVLSLLPVPCWLTLGSSAFVDLCRPAKGAEQTGATLLTWTIWLYQGGMLFVWDWLIIENELYSPCMYSPGCYQAEGGFNPSNSA